MKAIITIGCPGSGKTTFANSMPDYTDINRDDARMLLFGLAHYSEYKFTKARESAVTRYCIQQYSKNSEVGNSIIISDTNLNVDRRKHLRELLEALGYEVEERTFHASFEELIKRNDSRSDKTIPRSVLYRFWNQYLEHIGHEKYTPDRANFPAYIVDVDGTLAQMHNRGPFEWDKVGQDLPRQAVIDVVNNVGADTCIIVMSGRDGCCYDATFKWLVQNGVYFDVLLMREPGDTRKDNIVKKEMFDTISQDNNVVGVFDDRPQVVRMWRDLGLTVFNVGELDNEF